MQNRETFYDNSNFTQYIRITANDSDFFAYVINELDNNNNILNVILDLKGASNDISIDFLMERLKQYGNVISLVNNSITGPLLSKINEVSTSTLNYDTLAFRDEKQKEDFEKDLTTNLLNLPLEKVDSLLEFSDERYNNAVSKIYLDLIIKDYAEYLDENSIERLKDALINLKLGENENLIRNLFSSIITPAFSAKIGTETNYNIKEALIDISLIDFAKRHGIMNDFTPSNPKYVIFLREKLRSLGSKESETTLIFKGSIEQLIEALAKDADEFISELGKVNNNQDYYSTLMHNIASLSPNSELLEKYLFKLSSRVDSKEEALSIINTTISEVMPEFSNQTNLYISDYLNNNGKHLSA